MKENEQDKLKLWNVKECQINKQRELKQFLNIKIMIYVVAKSTYFWYRLIGDINASSTHHMRVSHVNDKITSGCSQYWKKYKSKMNHKTIINTKARLASLKTESNIRVRLHNQKTEINLREDWSQN